MLQDRKGFQKIQSHHTSYCTMQLNYLCSCLLFPFNTTLRYRDFRSQGEKRNKKTSHSALHLSARSCTTSYYFKPQFFLTNSGVYHPAKVPPDKNWRKDFVNHLDYFLFIHSTANLYHAYKHSCNSSVCITTMKNNKFRFCDINSDFDIIQVTGKKIFLQ